MPSYAFELSFYLNNVVGGESSPNSVPPAANRIIQTPGSPNEAFTAALVVEDGTSLAVTLWFWDGTSGAWISIDSVTVDAGTISYIMVPPSAQLFAQLGTNIGSVTKFGIGFIPGQMGSASGGGGGSLPAGAATSAKQDVGNASLSTVATTLASILAKIIASPATETTLAAAKADLDTLNSTVATAAAQATGNATLSTLSATLSSLVTANHTDLTQLHADIATTLAALVTIGNTSLGNIDVDLDAVKTSLASIDTKTPALVGGRQPVVLLSAGTTGAAAPSTANLFGGIDGNGNLQAMRCNASGIQQQMPGRGSANDSTAYESSHVYSASPCEPSRVGVYSKAAGSLTFMLFNAASLPSNSALPKECPTPASPSNRTTTNYAHPTGRYSVGMVGALSTINTSLLLTSSADGWFTVEFWPATT